MQFYINFIKFPSNTHILIASLPQSAIVDCPNLCWYLLNLIIKYNIIILVGGSVLIQASPLEEKKNQGIWFVTLLLGRGHYLIFLTTKK